MSMFLSSSRNLARLRDKERRLVNTRARKKRCKWAEGNGGRRRNELEENYDSCSVPGRDSPERSFASREQRGRESRVMRDRNHTKTVNSIRERLTRRCHVRSSSKYKKFRRTVKKKKKKKNQILAISLTRITYPIDLQPNVPTGGSQ